MMEAQKILIVDDDKDFSALVSAYLKFAGYWTVPAYDAMQGFMFAQREKPHLILLDLNMPAGGGFTLLGKLRQSPKTRTIPVIIVTAMQEPELETEATAKGAEGFLRKPVDRDGIVEAVRRVLG